MLKKLLYATALTAAFTTLSGQIWLRGAWDRWEFPTWNARVALRAAPGAATEQVKVILLDQSSLDWAFEVMGLSWPWPREVYAPILQFCHRAGARAVAFDVLYTEPSAYGVADDEVLGEAIRDGVPFVPAAFLGEGIGRFAEWPDYVPDLDLAIEGLETWLGSRERGDVIMPRASFPIPEVVQYAAMVADVKGSQDSDSVIRRGALFRVFDGRAVPALGLSAYFAARNEDVPPPVVRIEEGRLTVGDRSVPIDRNGRAIFRYRGPSGTHKTFTAAQIIQAELRLQSGEPSPIDPAVFEDAYVFFGFSAPGLLDLRPTPLSPVTPGVEVHVTMLDNFLSNDFFRLPASGYVMAATALMVWLASTAILLARKAWQSVIVFLVFWPLPWVLGFVLYEHGFWWPIIMPFVPVAFATIGAVMVSYALEGRQKAFIKGAFKHYLSPAVIEQILEDPSQLQLGGERRTLSIFFSDLAGFSTISEKLEPQELTRLLNDYLSDMTDIILDEGGTLDKYEGDAIIAFWNAPLNQPDHALRAARTALRCQRKLAERRPEYKDRTGVELYMRIGVNTGDVVVGNMGSRERFDYTVLGDAANLAARLEGANKAFGTATMLAEATWSAVGPSLVGREIGRITVVGRKTPERVFEVLGFEGETASIPLHAFHEALRLCEAREWAAALALFEQWPEDALARKYADRCRALCAEPGETWDGVWNLTEK